MILLNMFYSFMSEWRVGRNHKKQHCLLQQHQPYFEASLPIPMYKTVIILHKHDYNHFYCML